MKKICILIIFTLLYSSAYAQEFVRPVSIIDTPSAFTIARGTYQISMFAYDQGGINFKTFIGLHEAVFLGVSYDVEHAIGKDKPEQNYPGVVAKLKLTDGWESFPISMAIGYDSFYFGSIGKIENFKSAKHYEVNDYNRMFYGPYAAITKPLYAFGDEQYFSFGVRLPVYPVYVPGDTSYFLSLDIPLGKLFTFKIEGERIYYNFKQHDDWLLNAALRFNFMGNAGIDFCFMFQNDEKVNRIIKVEYTNVF